MLRVPYPLAFYTNWVDGRTDDPNAGWKGTTSKVIRFQLRPDPLAR